VKASRRFDPHLDAHLVRMLDLTTHNHASFPGNSPTWPNIDEAAFAPNSDNPFPAVASEVKKHCSGAAKRRG
jgi:hypothetical protein